MFMENKKYLINLAIVSSCLVMALSGCTGTGAEEASETTNTIEEEGSAEATEEVAEFDSYEAGTYVVGQDIPAGEYVIFGTGGGKAYVEISDDEKELFSGNFSYNEILTIEEGQKFSLISAYAVPCEKSIVDTTGEGKFKVGTHIEAGEYIILPGKDVESFTTMQYSIESSSKPLEKEVLDSKELANLGESITITVNDGEYLSLSGCYITTKDNLAEAAPQIVDGVQMVYFDSYAELGAFTDTLEDTAIVVYHFFVGYKDKGQAIVYDGAHYTIPESFYLDVVSSKNIQRASSIAEYVYVGKVEDAWGVWVNTTGTDIEVPVTIEYEDGTEETITIYVTKEWEDD